MVPAVPVVPAVPMVPAVPVPVVFPVPVVPALPVLLGMLLLPHAWNMKAVATRVAAPKIFAEITRIRFVI
jgi:hypothetical protein